jgi:HK97 family phage major capsid protein
VTYNKVADIANALPSQYWALPTTAWFMTPTMIQTLRQLKDTAGLPLFLELGEPGEGGAVGSIFGWPVIPNPFMSSTFPIYLANWDRFLTIADVEEMNIQMMEQTAPGYVTMYAEKRVASSVRDPFAGVRASAA